ncbi:beta-ketoacyl-[acyl-carrier-protein] synthase family protein [Kitasatospora sp. NBC_01302]|uniref:beta-ketoacyl-[acyl-carrier-protein] synthase family protein n=1 Tax=Kitasatospora sp. NBC_01302 TaxID=2903575 RepID=UPI003FA3DD15
MAITGIGVQTAGGNGVKAFWELLTSGRTAIRKISSFDTTQFRSRIAAECDFDPLAQGLNFQQARRLDRVTQFALVTEREALADSGLDPAGLDPTRVGVVIGTATGASISLDQEYAVASNGGSLWEVDHTYLSRHMYANYVPSSIAVEVARDIGAEGPVSVVSTGCTSGIDALAHACELLAEGAADVIVSGATEAPITPITVACFDAIKATSPRNDDPATASRPFDRTRNGFVLAEGAAVLVLERADRARARGAHIYAEIAGFANRGNAYHMTGLRPDGAELAEAITAALDAARLDPSEVDYVNAHGSGTKQNDRHETAAFKKALGEHARAIPVSSIKSMIGHSLGAIGSIEIAACALAIEHSVVPPTANLTEPDPECDLDYVPITARDQRLNTVLSVGSGFGGFQSAMVLTAPGVTP